MTQLMRLMLLATLIVIASCEKQQAHQDAADSSSVEIIQTDAPAWYKELPESGQFFYGKGTARSRRVTIAREKALLAAQAELALKARSGSNLEQEVVLERGLLKEQQTVKEGQQWRVYVLLEMAKKTEEN